MNMSVAAARGDMGKEKRRRLSGCPSFLLSVDVSVRSTACEVIERNAVVVGELYQIFQWNRLETAFVSGVNSLLDTEKRGDGGLGQVSVFAQIAYSSKKQRNRLLSNAF